MSPIALLLSTSVALAADPFTTSPAPVAAPQNGIEIVREVEERNGATMAFVLSCAGEGENVINALKARSDVNTLVVARDPTAADLRAWMATRSVADMHTWLATDEWDSYQLALVVDACPGGGGDIDDEITMFPDGSLFRFADLVELINNETTSSVWIIDASRESLGPTADDVLKVGARGAVGISGPPNTMTEEGILEALAEVISDSRGGPITIGALSSGIKLELATTNVSPFMSFGIDPNNMWEDRNKVVLPGGPLIEPAPAPFIPPAIPIDTPNARKPVPAGCWVAGGGALGLVASAIPFGVAASDQNWIGQVNDGKVNASDEELNAAVRHMRQSVVIGGVVAGVSGVALVGGTIWTGTTVHATPHGIESRSTF